MQKALVHYFSGTGNSLLAAKQICEELAKYEYEITFHAIENGLCDNLDSYNLHIFFFPIYATSVPHIMRKYMLNLPSGNKTKAVVISTNGKVSTHFRDGYQGWALHEARLYLKLRNYDVFFSETLDYPHNITVAFPPRGKKYNQIIISQVQKKIAAIAQKIAEGQKYHRKFFWPNIIWSIPFGILYTIFGRRFIGKLFAADSKCNSCKLCAKKCPVKAIDASQRQMRWRWNCEGCLRCINNCPKKAIQTSTLRIIAFIIASCVNPFFLIYKYIPDWFDQSLGKAGYAIFSSVLDIVLVIMFFILLDWVIYGMAYIPMLNRATSWGHTRLFGRYRAEEFEEQFLNKQ